MKNKELPKEILERYTQENEIFDKYIVELKNHFAKTKESFIRQPPFPLNNIAAANNMINIYMSTVFFPDDEIEKKFLEFGIKKDDPRWLTNIEKWKEYFTILENAGTIIYRNKFMYYLHCHLTLKISHDVIGWCEIYEETKKGKKPLTLTSQIERALERTNYKSTRPYKPTREKEVLNAFGKEILEIEKNQNLPEHTILGLLRNKNIDKYFYADWLRDSFPYSEKFLKGNLFLSNMIPAFEYIFLDQIPGLPKSLDELGHNKNGNPKYLGKDLKTIQCQILRKWIFKV